MRERRWGVKKDIQQMIPDYADWRHVHCCQDTLCLAGNACTGKPDLLLLDINAFPGFEKLPDYEELYVLFLLSLFASEDSQDLHLTRFVAHSHVCSPRDPSSAD